MRFIEAAQCKHVRVDTSANGFNSTRDIRPPKSRDGVCVRSRLSLKLEEAPIFYETLISRTFAGAAVLTENPERWDCECGYIWRILTVEQIERKFAHLQRRGRNLL